MRNRMIKKEFWTDDKILELPVAARLLFIGMWNFADDSGILKNNIKVLKAQIFPIDDINHEELLSLLKMMQKLGLILVNDDRTLIKIKNWDNHQKINRPTPSTYEFVEGSNDMLNDSSLNPHGVLTPNRKERKGIERNIKNQTTRKDELFDCFYKKYPRKVGKQHALKAFSKLSEKDKELSVSAIDKHVVEWRKSETLVEHIPHPASWLNGKRWEDDLSAVDLGEDIKARNMARRSEERKKQMEEVAKNAATPEEVRTILLGNK